MTTQLKRGVPLLLLFIAPTLLAQPTPLGDNFQVNTYTTSYQVFSDIAFDEAGNFVVVWDSLGSFGSDTSSYSVQAQRYASDGSAIGGQFQVNTTTSDYQLGARVAMNASGAFVVAWDSETEANEDSFGIRAQRFDSDGSAVGGQIAVNSYTTGGQFSAEVAMHDDGGFVVSWSSAGSAGDDVSLGSIQLQRFASDGSFVGSQLQVNSYTSQDQQSPAITTLADGGFVIVWQSAGSNGTDIDGFSIQAQRFDSAGIAVGGELQVNTYTTSSQTGPAIDAGDGSFVVVWASDGSAGDDNNYLSVQARRYALDGVAVGDDFQVNTYTTSNQYQPAVAVRDNGDFFVVWRAIGGLNATDDLSIQGAFFEADGDAIGEELQVNTYTPGFQGIPTVGSDGGERFVVTWSSVGSDGTDNDVDSIQARRFELPLPLFADGFESGDLTAWSASFP